MWNDYRFQNIVVNTVQHTNETKKTQKRKIMCSNQEVISAVDVVEVATNYFWNVGPWVICRQLFDGHMEGYIQEKSKHINFDSFFVSLDKTKKREYMELAINHYSDYPS